MLCPNHVCFTLQKDSLDSIQRDLVKLIDVVEDATTKIIAQRKVIIISLLVLIEISSAEHEAAASSVGYHILTYKPSTNPLLS